MIIVIILGDPWQKHRSRLLDGVCSWVNIANSMRLMVKSPLTQFCVFIALRCFVNPSKSNTVLNEQTTMDWWFPRILFFGHMFVAGDDLIGLANVPDGFFKRSIYIYIETDHYWFHPFLPSGMITISTYCEHHKEAIAHVLGADCDMVCRRDAEEGGTGALAYILTLGILANFSSRTSAEFDEFWVRCFTPGILDLPIFGKQSSEYALALIMS